MHQKGHGSLTEVRPSISLAGWERSGLGFGRNDVGADGLPPR
jgi:hypothetical protein